MDNQCQTLADLREVLKALIKPLAVKGVSPHDRIKDDAQALLGDHTKAAIKKMEEGPLVELCVKLGISHTDRTPATMKDRILGLMPAQARKTMPSSMVEDVTGAALGGEAVIPTPIPGHPLLAGPLDTIIKDVTKGGLWSAEWCAVVKVVQLHLKDVLDDVRQHLHGNDAALFIMMRLELLLFKLRTLRCSAATLADACRPTSSRLATLCLSAIHS